MVQRSGKIIVRVPAADEYMADCARQCVASSLTFAWRAVRGQGFTTNYDTRRLRTPSVFHVYSPTTLGRRMVKDNGPASGTWRFVSISARRAVGPQGESVVVGRFTAGLIWGSAQGRMAHKELALSSWSIPSIFLACACFTQIIVRPSSVWVATPLQSGTDVLRTKDQKIARHRLKPVSPVVAGVSCASMPLIASLSPETPIPVIKHVLTRPRTQNPAKTIPPSLTLTQ